MRFFGLVIITGDLKSHHASFSPLFFERSKLLHHVLVGSASLRRRRRASQQGTELARLKPV